MSGLVTCNLHGRQSGRLVTPGIGRAVLEDTALDTTALGKFQIQYLAGEEPTTYWADVATLTAFGLQPDCVIRIAEDFDRLGSFLSLLQPVCSKCFESWLQRHGLDAEDT